MDIQLPYTFFFSNVHRVVFCCLPGTSAEKIIVSADGGGLAMKAVHENNLVLKKIAVTLLCFLFTSLCVNAQDAGTDTVATEADSAIAIDTGYEHQIYFDHKATLSDTLELRQVPGKVIDSLKKSSPGRKTSKPANRHFNG